MHQKEFIWPIRNSLAGNSSLPPEAIAQIACESDSWSELMALVGNKAIWREILEYLVQRFDNRKGYSEVVLYAKSRMEEFAGGYSLYY